MARPFVITLSGSDASGAAGLQADNRALLAAGAFPLNVVSALTLQTDQGVESLELIAPDLIHMHLLGLLKRYPVSVIKAGMLGRAGTVRVLADALEHYPDVKLILDPVLRASSGRPLLDGEGISILNEKLLPQTFLLTPNVPELKALSGLDFLDSDEAEQSAVTGLLKSGCRNVLVKGGHRGGEQCVDRLYSEDGVAEYTHPRLRSENTRGTGCALASLIAGEVAKGLPLKDAVGLAKERLYKSLSDLEGEQWQGRGPGFL